MGNHQGPQTLSFFAIDRNLTVRVWVNGTEFKDVELAHGTSGYVRGVQHGSCLGTCFRGLQPASPEARPYI